MKDLTKFYINGQWVESADGHRIWQLKILPQKSLWPPSLWVQLAMWMLAVAAAKAAFPHLLSGTVLKQRIALDGEAPGSLHGALRRNG